MREQLFSMMEEWFVQVKAGQLTYKDFSNNFLTYVESNDIAIDDEEHALFEEFMMTLMYDVLVQSCLSSPARTHLAEMLSSYQKQALLDVARAHPSLTVDSTVKKAELVNTLSEFLQKKFENHVLYGRMGILSWYDYLIRRFRDGDITLDEMDQLVQYVSMGFIFCYREGQFGEVTLHVPQEFVAIVERLFANPQHLDFAMKSELYSTYTVALANLYGGYKVDQLAAVWQAHFNETFNPLHFYQVIEEIGNYLPVVVENNWVKLLIIKEEFAEFIAWANQATKPYYMPTKSDIHLYAEEVSDVDSDEFEALERFVAGEFSYYEAEQVLQMLVYQMKLGLTATHVLEELRYRDGRQLFRFMATKREAFIAHYSTLYDVTRMWVNNGFTPLELSGQHQDGLPNNIIQFPKR